jgi:hypothetical protein
MRKHTTGTSYTIGPLNPQWIERVTVTLSDKSKATLLLPDAQLLSPVIGATQSFYDGVIAGLENPEEEFFGCWNMEKFVYEVYASFSFDLCHDGSYAWSVGFVLGSLSYLAIFDELQALVGIAHVCYLLELVPSSVSSKQLSSVLKKARSMSDAAVALFLDRVREIEKGGVPWKDAQVVALGGQAVATLHARRQTPDARYERIEGGGPLVRYIWEVA